MANDFKWNFTQEMRNVLEQMEENQTHAQGELKVKFFKQTCRVAEGRTLILWTKEEGGEFSIDSPIFRIVVLICRVFEMRVSH